MTDFSTYTKAQRHIAHRAGRGDGSAEREADWIQQVSDSVDVSGKVDQMYPVSDYAIKIDAVTGDDITTQLMAACERVNNAGYGVILLPPCPVMYTQPMSILPAGGSSSPYPTRIIGRGHGTDLTYHPDHTGPYKERWAIEIGDQSVTPDAPLSTAYAFDVGLHGFTLRAGAIESGHDHGGISAKCTVAFQMSDVTVRGFDMPSARGAQWLGSSDSPVQETKLQMCSILGNRVGAYMETCTNVFWHGVYCAQNVDAEVSTPHVANWFWSGGTLQGSAPYGWRCVPADGAVPGQIVDVTIEHVYSENVSGRHSYHMDAAGAVGIEGVTIRQNVDAGPNTDDYHYIHANLVGTLDIGYCRWQNSAPAKFLYARNSGAIIMRSKGHDPATIDVDAATAAGMIWIGSSGNTLGGGVGSSISIATAAPVASADVALNLGKGVVRLASYAIGSEPTDVTIGDTVRCATTGRIKTFDGTYWQHHAYIRSPEIPLATDLVEYWDARVTANTSVISSAADSWTGILAGTVLSAAGASNRAPYLTSDPDFNNEPSLEFSSALHQLRNLAVTGLLSAGEFVNVTLVIRFGSFAASPDIAPIFSFQDGGAGHQFFGLDQNSGGTDYVGTFITADGGGFAGNIPSGAVLASGVHLVSIRGSVSATDIQIDGVSATPGTAVPLPHNLSVIRLGSGAGAPVDYATVAPDWKIAAMYVHRNQPADAALAQAFVYVQEIWG